MMHDDSLARMFYDRYVQHAIGENPDIQKEIALLPGAEQAGILEGIVAVRKAIMPKLPPGWNVTWMGDEYGGSCTLERGRDSKTVYGNGTDCSDALAAAIGQALLLERDEA